MKGADKSGKIAITETEDYLEHCELLLNYREFYGKLDANPTQIYTQEVKQKIDEKKKTYSWTMFVYHLWYGFVV